MNVKIAIAALLLCGSVSLHAQLHGGFKTGLNFARFSGPIEKDLAGKELETFKNITGFHIGAAFSYHFSDNFGLRGELMYSKKGASYTFDGQSYRSFSKGVNTALTTGRSQYSIKINNSNIDLPVMGFARWKDFEFSAGVYASLLVQSIGEGALTYYGEGVEALQDPKTYLQFNLDHNYNRDKPGEGDAGQTLRAKVNGVGDVTLPKSLGAYYDLTEDKGNLYKALDFGLTGGISYYLSHALYIGGRVQYGLTDLTNNDMDLSKTQLGDGNTPVFSKDKDHNFTLQASIGFNF